MTRAHRIQRMEIELAGDDRALLEQLSARVSALRDGQLFPVIERACEAESPRAEIERIAVLELDLGVLSGTHFDQQFVQRLEASLARALRTALSNARGTLREHPSLELISAFARTGNVPWWADARSSDLITRQLETLAREAPRELLVLLRGMASDEPALRRLSAHAAPMAAVLLPFVWPGFSHELERVLAETRAWLRSTADALERPPSSAHQATRSEPAQALQELSRPEQAAAQFPAGEPAATTAQRLAAWCGADERRLFQALLFAFTRARPSSLEAALQCIARALDPHAPEELMHGLGHAETAPGAARAQSKPANTRPGHEGSADFELRSVHGSAGRAPTGEAHAPESVTAPDAGHSAASKTARRDLTGRAHASDDLASDAPWQPPEAHARARRKALSSLEELHVHDAGLVLLWPFLERFFERTGLLDERRQFRDEEAVQQAMVLLGFLATGQEELAEPRMPLIKLLVGRAPDSAFAGAPLSSQQRDEATSLLRAVIDHARVLGSLESEAFRALYLERAGILEVEAGTWLLRVARASQDVVLERFPWSWHWLKLPWMTHSLRVQW